MKLLRTTIVTAALMTAAVMSITSPAQAQTRLAWWGWPGLVAAPNPYATAYGYYPRYGYGYRSGFGYAANTYAPAYTSYGMWNNPWYTAAYHPVSRRHVPPIVLTRAARHWQ